MSRKRHSSFHLGTLLMLLLGVAVMKAEASSAPLVFIHGIKGAVLKDKAGDTKWLTAWQGLGISTPTLSLPFEWKGDEQPKDELVPDGVIRGIRIVPYLLDQKIYGPWLDAAGSLGHPFHVFAYDWRRDNFETLDRFERYLDALLKSTGEIKVNVVAHSMGGLITLALLHKRPDLFKSIVFAGVPFGGGIGFLPDLHSGTTTGLNLKILSWPVVSSFPSVYVFFPEEASSLVKSDGTPDVTRFYELSEWKRQGLSFFGPGSPAPTGYETFLDKALARAKRFRDLFAPKTIAYPPIQVVSGKALMTLQRARRHSGPSSSRGWDFESEPKAPGDGRILETNSLPPVGIPHKIYYSNREHSQLLNDPAVIEIIRNFL